MVDSTLVVGLGGLVTTLGAAYLSPLLTSRSTDKAWKRDKKAQVYADALIHMQVISGHMFYAVDGSTLQGNVDPKERPKPDFISANMQLFAPPKVRKAWDRARKDDIEYFEQWDQIQGHPSAFNWTDPWVLNLQVSIEQCREAIQADMR